MADEKQIEAKIIEIIAEQLGREKDTITSASDIANDLGADSLDVAELMIAFEESFDIDIDEENAQNIATVGDVVKQIVSQLDEN
ncbi:MAG: acyl carrier protein [Thermoguttaceae bacterium]|nr:acyl carrier protein [Thermoguttaceae bacterium]